MAVLTPLSLAEWHVLGHPEYYIPFSGTYSGIGKDLWHVCTGLCNRWDLPELWANSVVVYRDYIQRLDTIRMLDVGDALNLKFVAAEVKEDGAFRIPWRGRAGTAELEMLTCLFAARHTDLLHTLEDRRTKHPEVDPAVLFLRKGLADPYGGIYHSAPYSGYSPEQCGSRREITYCGWYLWLTAKRLGIAFNDYDYKKRCPVSGTLLMPYAGMVLGNSLRDRFGLEFTRAMCSVIDEYVSGKGKYREYDTGTKLVEYLNSALQTYLNDGFTPITVPYDPKNFPHYSDYLRPAA